jgi:hypothetical protein
MTTAFYFFGGLAEMFLSVMLWFILDKNKVASVYIDGGRVYSVTKVINVEAINYDCEEDQVEEHEEELVG